MFSVVLSFLISTSLFAMIPNRAIGPQEEDYEYYMSIIRKESRHREEGRISNHTDYDVFNVHGRIVPYATSNPTNPINLVMTVNGNLYYVDTILSSLKTPNGAMTFKARRRWKNNPEPGVFIVVEGKRTEVETGEDVPIQIWMKVATTDGHALDELVLLEGNFEL
jgi:hypothetical protein